MIVIRTCSYNVRYDSPPDARLPGEEPWDVRRDRVLERIRELAPDLVGVQEAVAHQFEDLERGLEEDGYEWYGVGRRDGNRAGEFVPLGWRRDRFEALETGAFWLSETPDKPSVGWDGDLPRVATWGLLRDRETGTRLWACSVHFDHRGRRARLEAAQVVTARADQWLRGGERSAGDEPGPGADAAIVLGDCNCQPGSPPYRALLTGGLEDAREIAGTVRGPRETVHAFDGRLDRRIDYVFTSPGTTVDRYCTLEPRADGYASDHVPVCAVVRPR